MTDVDFQVQVFSFNRGEFLDNCVRSLERCLPRATITIHDDHSDDPETRRVLERLNRYHRVLTPGANGPASKHGGLYGNMQTAWERLDDDALMGFIQDDMQAVRPVTSGELAAIDAHFRGNRTAGFVQPAFFKGSDRRRGRAPGHHDPVTGFYYAEPGKHSSGVWYSDICLARVGNLRAAGWRFQPRESLNEAQARGVFGRMAYMKNPFVAWLPSAPAWRGKQRTLALRLGERRHGCGFHPLEIMSEAENAAFRGRDPGELPYAEDFLRLRRGSLPTPWVYHPLQGSRWLKWLNSAELKLRRGLSHGQLR